MKGPQAARASGQEAAEARVRMIDLPGLHAEVAEELRAAFDKVAASGRFVLGPEVALLESELAADLGIKHAIGVSSGTDALTLALLAAGIERGDRVITPSFSFYSTAGTIARLGAVPVFADIDPGTFNLGVDLEGLLSGAKAILPVHLFGLAADMEPLLAMAKRHGLVVIEDAAQAIGASYPGRLGARAAGTFGDLGCFSFFPTKNLGALGDGGLVVTDNDALAERVRSLRTYGARAKHRHEELGGNHRLDELQAAFLRVKRPRLAEWTKRRQAHAQAYLAAFAGLPIELPKTPWGLERHAFHQFVIKVGERDRLRAHLGESGIDTEIYYPAPLHTQPVFEALAERGPLPHTERVAERALALPVHPTLSLVDRDRVISAVVACFAGR